jgi:hypothetical protein
MIAVIMITGAMTAAIANIMTVTVTTAAGVKHRFGTYGRLLKSV